MSHPSIHTTFKTSCTTAHLAQIRAEASPVYSGGNSFMATQTYWDGSLHIKSWMTSADYQYLFDWLDRIDRSNGAMIRDPRSLYIRSLHFSISAGLACSGMGSDIGLKKSIVRVHSYTRSLTRSQTRLM
jgi:hypothetical protein